MDDLSTEISALRLSSLNQIFADKSAKIVGLNSFTIKQTPDYEARRVIRRKKRKRLKKRKKRKRLKQENGCKEGGTKVEGRRKALCGGILRKHSAKRR
ncbi:hypothetical protein [Scardovia inopinata]|uniref:hypothetical protein n=1 Tax=Scardovia inopinata TaxID=78259 RepID=UPI0005FC6F87|nr:hypothetical protein [Scardovia inopinata]BAR07339.1 hypothetical protein SCIP_1272 [Scardovia inopinata JCM 12537]